MPKRKIHSSWTPYLEPLFDLPEVKKLNNILHKVNYLPEREDIFNVFTMPLNKIRVVILGQDPYPDPQHPIGYAFATKSKNIPKSLQAIHIAIANAGIHPIEAIKDPTLKAWRDQGIFLLNPALTVKQWNSGSHLRYWKRFTEGVIKVISKENPCIWLLWGGKAKAFNKLIKGERNTILEWYHPAARQNQFLECPHFNDVNNLLSEPINW
jgi:uracil-DNA glycosylase